jgi:uncharacterized protein YbdZ (MbtH family)/acyl carrier protein
VRPARETELLLDPEFFTAVRAELPAIQGVDLRLKRGRRHNELTRYRYDVVLTTAPPGIDLAVAPHQAWPGDVGRLRAQLSEQRREVLRITGVPNPRVATEVAATEALRAGRPVPDLASPPDAPDPEDFQALGGELGYEVLPTLSPDDDAAMDVVVLRRRPGALTGTMRADGAPRSWAACANTPVAPGASLSSDVGAHLRERLPAYMVPDTITVLPALPLTPNGKVDRAALPEPVGPVSRTVWQPAPRSLAQRALRDIFADVLGLPRGDVSPDGDFFELGGHSLAAARVVERVRPVLGVDIGIKELYESRTPARLAQRVEGQPPREPAAVEHPPSAPATPEQRRWLAGTGEDTIALRLRFTGNLNEETLWSALRKVVSRHETLRTVFSGTGEDIVQTVLAELPPDAPLDLRHGLPWRAQLAVSGPDEHLMTITMHRIAADERSLALIAQDLVDAYLGVHLDARRQVTLQYRDAPAPVAAPPVDGAPRRQAARYELPVPAALVDRISELAARLGATVPIVLHATLAGLLGRRGRRGPIGITVPGRDHPALDRVVGPLDGCAAVPVDLSGDPTVRELIERTRAARRRPRSGLPEVEFDLAEPEYEHEVLPDLTVRAEHPLPATIAGDLQITVTDRHDVRPPSHRFACVVDYAHAEYAAPEIASLAGSWLMALAAAVAQPDERFSRIGLLGDAERQLVARWGAGAASSREEPGRERYVLDAALRPVPPGVLGSVYVAHDDPGARRLERWPGAAENLVADPLGPPGGRMWCTGETGAWTGDGRLVPCAAEGLVTSPFDDQDALYQVLENQDGAHSVWPSWLPPPRGWAVAQEEDLREASLAFVEGGI